MVRLSSLDGDPVYRVREEIISEPGGRRERRELSRRNRWPVFGGRARSERSERDEEVYSYATSRRVANDLLYGTSGGDRGGGGRAYSEVGGGRYGGHIHTRFNPMSRTWRDEDGRSESSQRSHRSRRSRAWSRGQPSLARSLIDGMRSLRGRPRGQYMDESPRGGGGALVGGSHYAESNRSIFRSERDYAQHTYPRFVVPGWAHIVVGFFLVVVGIVDIGWTASKYEGGCDFERNEIFNGCATQNIFTYIAAPIWGGIVMIFIGALTFTMTPFKLLRSTWLLYVFLGGCFFLLIAICPAIITLYVLLITENEDRFWANDSSRGIILQDDAKFAIAVVIMILAFIDWIVAMICVLLAIFCPPQTETDFGKDPYASRGYRSYIDESPEVIQAPPEPRRSSRRARNYPESVPEIITTEVRKPRSEGGRSAPGGRGYASRGDRLQPGDRIVHEEVVRPGPSRSRDDRSDGESYYSRDRRSDGYARGGRDDGGYARSDYSRGSRGDRRVYDLY